MRSIFDARLVNDPFGDPGVYVDFRFERRALLFDMSQALAGLERQGNASAEAVQLAACYHRLVQMWAQP